MKHPVSNREESENLQKSRWQKTMSTYLGYNCQEESILMASILVVDMQIPRRKILIGLAWSRTHSLAKREQGVSTESPTFIAHNVRQRRNGCQGRKKSNTPLTPNLRTCVPWAVFSADVMQKENKSEIYNGSTEASLG